MTAQPPSVSTETSATTTAAQRPFPYATHTITFVDDSRTTTLADGTFAFHGVPESDGAGYTLTQPAQPLGTQSGFTTAGTTGGTATPKSTTPSQITGINLSGANEVSAENLFGEIDPRGPPPPGGWTTTGIPTLSEWGLLALSMLMAWLGLMQVRRRPAS